MMKACQKYMPMYQTKMLQNESIDIRSDTRYERTTSESEKEKKKNLINEVTGSQKKQK